MGVTALLLVAGAGVRILSAPEGSVEWQSGEADTVVVDGLAEVRGDAAAELERERIRSTPLAPGERIDPNRADVLQLERLPRVGPALAERIVAWRENHGRFRSLVDLDSVEGVGPSMLESLAPHLDLPATARRPASRRGAGEVAELIDVNRATGKELEVLPGIGPALAERIIASRESDGPFRTVDELQRVAGIGPALLERLRPLVRAGR